MVIVWLCFMEREQRVAVLPPCAVEITSERMARMRNEAREFMKDVPDSHGWGHTTEVEGFAIFLALRNFVNPGLARTAAIGHDWRFYAEGDREARGLTELVKPKPQKDRGKFIVYHKLVKPLWEEGLVGIEAAASISRTIRRHGQLPWEAKTRQPLEMVVGEADRFARLTLLGILHTLEANQWYDLLAKAEQEEYDKLPETEQTEKQRPERVPLYKKDTPIQRLDVKEGRYITFSELRKFNSGIYDLRSEVDWGSPTQRFIQTRAGRELAQHLIKMPKRFLATFAKAIKSEGGEQLAGNYQIWVDWLKSIIKSQEVERATARELLMQGKVDEYKQALFKLEDPKLLSWKKFEEFRSNYQTSSPA